jgi:hypothetical protein
MTSIKTLENSIYWQNVVLKQSKCPKQKERVRQSIARLEAQLQALKSEKV